LISIATGSCEPIKNSNCTNSILNLDSINCSDQVSFNGLLCIWDGNTCKENIGAANTCEDYKNNNYCNEDTSLENDGCIWTANSVTTGKCEKKIINGGCSSLGKTSCLNSDNSNNCGWLDNIGCKRKCRNYTKEECLELKNSEIDGTCMIIGIYLFFIFIFYFYYF
jgi:hypothetical protein